MRQRSPRRIVHGDSTDAHRGTVGSPLGQPLPPPLVYADANIGTTSNFAEKARFPPSTRGFDPVTMQNNILTAELQLYRLLMKHLEDSTRPQPYPKAVVDFAEFVRREAENDLDHAVFLEGVKHTSSAMAEIFYNTRSDEKRFCSPALVDFACRVYEAVIADDRAGGTRTHRGIPPCHR